MADALAIIFIRRIQVGYFPNLLKIARVKPLLKTVDMQNTLKTTV